MKVIGFGAALVDKQFLVKDDALSDLGIEKGLMTLNSEEEQNELLTFLQNQNAGTQNAAFIAGGFTGTGGNNVGSGSEAFQQTSLAWDGLSYTTVGCMTNERGSGGVVGTMNSSLAQGSGAGQNSHSTCTEEWNGSAWSTAAASNFATA